MTSAALLLKGLVIFTLAFLYFERIALLIYPFSVGLGVFCKFLLPTGVSWLA